MNDAALLYVSDDPEKFVGPGRLFAAELPSDGRVARILIDHINGAGRRMRVIACIANISDVRGAVAVAGFAAGPPDGAPDAKPGDLSRNGMAVGHRATAGFLTARLVTPGGSIEQFVLERGGMHVLTSHELQSGADAPVKMDGQCVAGIWSFLSVAGIRCELRVMACEVDENESVWGTLKDAENVRQEQNAKEIAKGPNTKRLPFRSGVFDIAGREGRANAENQIGLDTGFVDVGRITYPRAEGFPAFDGSEYEGEYGVMKFLSCHAGGAKAGRLTEEARGCGNATATYLVNGERFESQQFAPDHECGVAEVVPDDDGVIRVVTMAEINSTLPVRVRVRTAPGKLGTVAVTRSSAVIAQGGPRRAARVG